MGGTGRAEASGDGELQLQGTTQAEAGAEHEGVSFAWSPGRVWERSGEWGCGGRSRWVVEDLSAS